MRRHLTESQRATVAAKIATMKQGGDGSNQHKRANPPIGDFPPSQAEAAELMNVSARSVQRATKVREHESQTARLESGATFDFSEPAY